MIAPTVRLHFIDASGRIVDGERSFSPAAFGGALPAIGDEFLGPPRSAADGNRSRQLLRVVRRVFNPRDLPDYIALICERRDVWPEEMALVPDERTD